MAENLLEESKSQLSEQQEIEDVEAYYEQNGLENTVHFMEKKIEMDKNVSVKIAVTGRAGTGKSVFVNTFRGLTADDVGAAEVGSTETTTVPQEYRHPSNKNVTLWDLPGVGTSKFNRDNYEERVNFGSYDFFLIFTKSRIFEDDVWLAKKAQFRHKKYFIVRTHIDVDVDSDNRNHPQTHNAEQLLKRISDKTKEKLEEQGVYPENGAYLISTLLDHVEQWDYRKLEIDMLHALPRGKREVLTLSLNNPTENLIKEKCQILRSHVWKKAVVMAAKGFVPSARDSDQPSKITQYFNDEISRYTDALGLDDESLRRLSQRTGRELKSLILMRTKNIEIPIGGLTLGTAMSLLISPHKARTIIFPVLGIFVTLGRSYTEAYRLLHEILDRLESASLEVLKTTLSSAPHREVLHDRKKGGDDEA